MRGGGTDPKSDQAELTALTVTIDNTDYAVTFDANQTAKVTIPSGKTITEITVKTATLSPKATGLQAKNELKVTAGRVSITITAENGTSSVEYTITLVPNIIVTEIAKTNPDADKRHHYVLFHLVSGDGSSGGRYKLALKPSTNPAAPTVQEMKDGDGVHRIVTNTEKRVLLSYTLGSEIGSYMERSDILAKAVKDGDTVGADVIDIDSYLLSPGESYTLYALKEGSDLVEAPKEFTTDAFSATSTTLIANVINDPALSGDYSYDREDPVFIIPSLIYSTHMTSHQLVVPKEVVESSVTLTQWTYTPNVDNAVSTYLLNTWGTMLIPSQLFDGNNIISIGGNVIMGFYVGIPKSQMKDRALELREFASVLLTFNLSLDQ